MGRICLIIAYCVALVSVVSFFAKLGVAKAFKDEKRKKALWNCALAFIIGFLVGVLVGIGMNLN